jgi:hypothetical protein
MKNSDELKPYGQNSLIERHRKELLEAAKHKANKYAELAEESKEDEARLFLAIRKAFSDEEWKKWWEEGACEEFAKDFARGEVKLSLDELDASAAQDDNIEKPVQSEKLTAGQTDRRNARAYAKARWEEDPTIKIKDMAEDIQQAIRFERPQLYKFRTIYDWINELAPNRKPGRRPKKT